MTSIACDDGTNTVTPTKVDDHNYTLTVNDGQDVVCTYTNRRKSGHLSLIKSVTGPADAGDAFAIAIQRSGSTVSGGGKSAIPASTTLANRTAGPVVALTS